MQTSGGRARDDRGAPAVDATDVGHDVAGRVAAFLDAHHVLSLATCGPCGPHAANVFYARDNFTLFWVSDPSSRHSIELDADPRVAATIAVDHRDFVTVCGLQIAGIATRMTDSSDAGQARALLEARYPLLKQLSEAQVSLREDYANAAYYRLEPSRIVLIDNRRGFGHKDTLDLHALKLERRRS